jgi:hypothetical protein
MEAVSFSTAGVENHCPKSLDELACVGIARALPLLAPAYPEQEIGAISRQPIPALALPIALLQNATIRAIVT